MFHVPGFIDGLPTALDVFFCFETKQNETTYIPRNAPVISAEELGAMPKNNLREITLVRAGAYTHMLNEGSTLLPVDNLLVRTSYKLFWFHFWVDVKRGASQFF